MDEREVDAGPESEEHGDHDAKWTGTVDASEEGDNAVTWTCAVCGVEPGGS
jgi:hypothetical protein